MNISEIYSMAKLGKIIRLYDRGIVDLSTAEIMAKHYMARINKKRALVAKQKGLQFTPVSFEDFMRSFKFYDEKTK